VDVSAAGTNTTFVYITSHVNGTLVVGTENLPFNVEPAAIPITAADRNRKIELTVHGNASLTAGQYLGKLTLLLQTGGNVAHGVKINASVTQQQSENVQNLYLIGIAFVVIAALTLGIYFMRSRRKLDRSRAGNDDFLKGIEPLDS
jgi:hypothetical protein